jgi:hypothetical protein
VAAMDVNWSQLMPSFDVTSFVCGGSRDDKHLERQAFERALARVGMALGPVGEEIRTLPPDEATTTTIDQHRGAVVSLKRDVWLLLHALRQVVQVGKVQSWRPLPWDPRRIVWDAWKVRRHPLSSAARVARSRRSCPIRLCVCVAPSVGPSIVTQPLAAACSWRHRTWSI